MEYRTLGSTGVRVSTHCLGTMMFGPWGHDDAEDCARIVRRAVAGAHRKGDQAPQPRRGIFANNASVIRLVGAVVLDMHEKWIAGDRRYLAAEGSMAKLRDVSDNRTNAAMEGGEKAPRITSKPTSRRDSAQTTDSRRCGGVSRCLDRYDRRCGA